MQRSTIIILLLSFLSAPLWSMSVWPVPVPEPTPMPRIKLPPSETPIVLQSMDVDVRIVGLHAETTQTLRFFNPNGRILAGELECVLPRGAVVSAYALDIQGRMVDGVIVGKQKARMVMDAEQRRRVDPGLVEHVRANLFNTRVYPIPANGTRMIKIVYVSDLTFKGADAAYHLPLPRTQSIAELKLSVVIDKGPVKPEIGGFGNVNLTDWNDQWKAEASFNNIQADNDLMIRLPKLPPQLINIESFMGQHYVSINRAFAEKAVAAVKRRHIALAWDASGSHDAAARAQEIQLLGEALKQWPGCRVDVRVFRNQLDDEIKTFNDFASLSAYLNGLAYDGATDFSKLDLSRAALPHVGAECWLLVSDGLHTLGQSLPKTDGLPVYTLSAATVQDTAFLRFIAAKSGAAFVNLKEGTEADVITALSGGQNGIMSVNSINDKPFMHDVHIVNAHASGRSQVYFRAGNSGTVVLSYRAAGGVEKSVDIALDISAAKPGHIIARAWAAQQANALALFPERNKQELIQLGNQYNLVTPGTSLLVLETLNQYLEHEIKPPASWPEMEQQYLAALKNRRIQQEQSEEQKIQMVLGWWQERVNWWQRDFNVGKDFRFAQKQIQANRGNLMVDAEEATVSTDDNSLQARVQDIEAPDAAHPEPAQRMRSVQGNDGGAVFMAIGSTDKKEKAGGGSAQASMTVSRWDPQTPYLTAIKAAPAQEAYAQYLQQRPTYVSSPAFYLDCAGYFMDRQPKTAQRILSNLAEMKIDNAALLRVYAWRLQEAGAFDRAEELLEKVLSMRDDEPQSHRDLALLLIQRYEQSGNRDDALRAAQLLYNVIVKNWQRFAQIEVLALTELNDLLQALPQDLRAKCDFVDKRLIQHLPVDVRIVLSWDADVTDVDLHVREPSGESANYSHNRTTIGGYVSRDFTQGYGPEDYFVKKAMPGTYQISAHYYGSSQQTLVGPCTVTATVFTNYGRPDEQRQVLTLRLSKPDETYVIGSIQIGDHVVKPMAAHGKAVERQPVGVQEQLSLDQIKALKIGMTKAAVIQALGFKGQESNNGMELLSYSLNDGSRVRLAFGPDLLWAHQIYNGAEISLLKQ